jgi:hypothetical protein
VLFNHPTHIGAAWAHNREGWGKREGGRERGLGRKGRIEKRGGWGERKEERKERELGMPE